MKEIKKTKKKKHRRVSKTHAKKEGDTVSKEGSQQPRSQLCGGKDSCIKEERIKSLTEVLSDFFPPQLALRKTPLCATQNKITMCIRLFLS